MRVVIYYANNYQKILERVFKKVEINFANETRLLFRNEVEEIDLTQKHEKLTIDHHELELRSGKREKLQIMVECMNFKELLSSPPHVITFLLSLTLLFFVGNTVYLLFNPAVSQSATLLLNLTFILTSLTLITTRFRFDKLSFHRISVIN